MTKNAAVPNLRNRIVRERVVTALSFAEAMLHPERPQPIHHDQLEAVFGPRSSKTRKWLVESLLIQTGTYKAGSYSYGYLLNAEGFATIAGMLSAEEVNTICSQRFLPDDLVRQLTSKQFDYKIAARSTRLVHSLQSIRREAKPKFWSEWGFDHHYDIQAAAPTILKQYAHQLGMGRLIAGAVQAYIDDRSVLRRHVSDLTGCDAVTAKRVINALFNGGRLVGNAYSAIFKMLGDRPDAVAALAADPEIQKLRWAIARIWQRIESKVGLPNGKWGLYFALERRVLDAIRSSLDEQGINHFCEHDGFVADAVVNLRAVQRRVEEVTGFEVVLERA